MLVWLESTFPLEVSPGGSETLGESERSSVSNSTDVLCARAREVDCRRRPVFFFSSTTAPGSCSSSSDSLEGGEGSIASGGGTTVSMPTDPVMDPLLMRFAKCARGCGAGPSSESLKQYLSF